MKISVIFTDILKSLIFTDRSVISTDIPNLAYILRHVTAKFAHMNGHWKAYNSTAVILKSVLPNEIKRKINITFLNKF